VIVVKVSKDICQNFSEDFSLLHKRNNVGGKIFFFLVFIFKEENMFILGLMCFMMGTLIFAIVAAPLFAIVDKVKK